MREVDHETERDRKYIRLKNPSKVPNGETITQTHVQTLIFDVIDEEFDEPRFLKCHRCDVIGSYVGPYPYCASCNWDSLKDPCLTINKGAKR